MKEWDKLMALLTGLVASYQQQAAQLFRLQVETIRFVTVKTYEEAVRHATGENPKRIRVTDEGQTFDYWPDSAATDKLERIITN